MENEDYNTQSKIGGKGNRPSEGENPSSGTNEEKHFFVEDDIMARESVKETIPNKKKRLGIFILVLLILGVGVFFFNEYLHTKESVEIIGPDGETITGGSFTYQKNEIVTNESGDYQKGELVWSKVLDPENASINTQPYQIIKLDYFEGESLANVSVYNPLWHVVNKTVQVKDINREWILGNGKDCYCSDVQTSGCYQIECKFEAFTMRVNQPWVLW